MIKQATPTDAFEYTRVADLKDLEPHGQFSKWIDGHDILFYRLEGEIKALSNICPHFGGPVGFHKAQNGHFTCLWHNYKFSTKDGSCLTNPRLPLRHYRVKTADGGIWVQLVEKD